MIIKDKKGQQHEFPEDATIDEINEALGMSPPSAQASSPAPEQESPGIFDLHNQRQPSNERSPMDALRDVGGGLAKGSQNLASSLLEGGEYVTRKGAEKMMQNRGIKGEVPKWNAREFMGLEGKNPIDLQSMIQSKNPDSLASAVGQYGLSLGAGGTGIAKQALTQGGYAASQADPNQENFVAPNGRAGAGLEGALAAAFAGSVPKAFGLGKKAVNYLRPGKDAEAFVKGLTPGIETNEQNIEQLGQRISASKEAKKEEALSEKREFMANAANNRVLPPQKNPNAPLIATMKAAGINPKSATTEQTKKLSSAIKGYFKSADEEKLASRMEDIFDHPGLNEKQIEDIVGSIELDKPILSNYQRLKEPELYGNKNIYNESMKEAHKDFVSKPTIRNADRLQSKLFAKQKNLKEQIKGRTGDVDQAVQEYNQLVRNRGRILKDINKHIETLPKDLQEKYSNFRKLWRENVTAYTNPGKGRSAIRQLSNNEKGVKPKSISAAFAYPNEQAKTVLSHIGDAGRRNVIRNELSNIDPSDARAVAKAMLKLKHQGFEGSITPDMESMAKSLKRRSNLKRGVIGVAGLGAGEELIRSLRKYL